MNQFNPIMIYPVFLWSTDVAAWSKPTETDVSLVVVVKVRRDMKLVFIWVLVSASMEVYYYYNYSDSNTDILPNCWNAEVSVVEIIVLLQELFNK